MSYPVSRTNHLFGSASVGNVCHLFSLSVVFVKYSFGVMFLGQRSSSVQKHLPPNHLLPHDSLYSTSILKRPDSLTKFVPAILGTPDAEARLRLATEIFIKQASISEVSKKIATAVDESLSKQQKEFFLRQQLTAIQRELHALQKPNGFMSMNQMPGSPSNKSETGSSSELDDDEQHDFDDLADLKRKIEAMAHGSEERKMGVREWRRLKRIPAGSVENGVIRSYVSFQPFSSMSIAKLYSLNGLLPFLGQIRRRCRMKCLYFRFNHSQRTDPFCKLRVCSLIQTISVWRRSRNVLSSIWLL